MLREKSKRSRSLEHFRTSIMPRRGWRGFDNRRCGCRGLSPTLGVFVGLSLAEAITVANLQWRHRAGDRPVVRCTL